MSSVKTSMQANTLDEIGKSYVQLALCIEQYLPGYIDAYFGPPEWKEQAVIQGQQSLAELMARARELVQTVQAQALDPQRKRFLSKQFAAMQTTLRILAKEDVPFIEEVQGLYDITPQRVDESAFENALRELAALLPGDGSVHERLRARRMRFEVSRQSTLDLFQIVKAEVRRRTHQLFALPSDEAVELRLVNDKPWGAYNWYLGKHRSLIEINTDSPLHANGIIGLIAHEGYPGHHTEHALKEQAIYEHTGWLEGCVLLINAPECVISEGIATTAAEVIFERGEAERWQRAELYARAGVTDDLSVAEVQRIQESARVLGSVNDNAALLLHVEHQSEEKVIEYLLRYSSRTPDEAKRSIRFMTDPVFRSYTFSYSYGYELLHQLFKQHDKVAVFRRALNEPLTPTDLREWLAT